MTLEDAQDYVWEHGKTAGGGGTSCRVAFDLPGQAALAKEFQAHLQALHARQEEAGAFTVPVPFVSPAPHWRGRHDRAPRS